MPMPPRPYGLMSAFDQADPTSPLADTLGMQEQPFYSAATGISQGGYDYMGDLGAALLAGSGWHAGPSSFGENLGQAMQTAEASHSDRLRTQMRNRLQGYEFKRQQRADKIEEQDRARADAAQAQRAAILQQMDPRYQALDVLGTGPAAQAAKAQMFPDTPDDYTVGNRRYSGATNKLIVEAPYAPSAPRNINTVPVIGPDGQIILVDENKSQGMRPAPAASTAQAPHPVVQVPPGEVPEWFPPGAYQRDTVTGELTPVRAASGGIQFNPDGTISSIGGPPKTPSGYTPTPGGGLAPTAGGPADQVTPGEAGMLAARATGADALASVRQQIIAPDGTVNRGLLANMEVPLPWTNGRTVNQSYAEGVEAKLRALTGAAAPETESARIKEMVTPSIWDSDEAVIAKMDRLQKFLGLSGQRNFSDILNTVQGGQTKEGSIGALPLVSTVEERDKLKPGTRYQAPDGTVRIR